MLLYICYICITLCIVTLAACIFSSRRHLTPLPISPSGSTRVVTNDTVSSFSRQMNPLCSLRHHLQQQDVETPRDRTEKDVVFVRTAELGSSEGRVGGWLPSSEIVFLTRSLGFNMSHTSLSSRSLRPPRVGTGACFGANGTHSCPLVILGDCGCVPPESPAWSWIPGDAPCGSG